ncbi:MAG TPA: hybrid sensor histidine kinase/response regulator [Steroidobacteraceae bacterium]|nr:hybrid sensor histidine kinase/response regulator [Steroidobacteraceae bacterium]
MGLAEQVSVGQPATRAPLVAAEQVRIQYRNMPTAIISNACVSLILCFTLRNSVPTTTLIGWLAAEYVWVASRFAQWRAFWRAQPAASNIARWRVNGIVGSAVNGIIYGVGGIILYVPGSLSSQFLLLIVQFGMGSGAIYASASSLPSFLLYFYPCLLLSSFPFFAAGDAVHITLGVMMLMFMAATTQFAVGISRSIRNAVTLRFENLDLIDELRAASAAKSRFLASASHDLRQPLHALGFFVDALPEHTAPAGMPVVDNIRRSLAAMDDLFNALLDVSRLDAGVVETHMATVPVASLLERVRFEFEPQARQKGLSLTIMPTSALVRSDPALLERIVRNFVSNAVRYTDRGGIVVGCRQRTGVVRIEVLDSGRGIPADKHHEIFQEFCQLDNPERDRRNGLGLGLAIVERVARLLDHGIELRSVVGKGSRFSVTVPRGRPEDRISTAASVQPPLDADVAGTLILLIDDEIAVRDGMQEQMRRWRCEVISAGSGEEIIEKAAALQHPPDLIVSDYRLRGEENGIQLVARLREEFNAEIPALIVTGDTGPERLREAQASGLHILHKPLNPARLRALIASLRLAKSSSPDK